MDRAGSPPSPLHSPPRSVRSHEHLKRAHRPPKDKEREKSHLTSASRELVRLLVHEEHESQELRSTVQALSERLTREAQRTDNAEARAKEAVVRFRQVNDARLAALQDAARLSEELQLYKLQLDNAQREIRRAQELLDALEAQRFEAEEAAARARSTARKLKEEKIVQVARDEGRLEGVREGMARGRVLGYEQGRVEGYERGRAAASREPSQKAFTAMVIPEEFDPQDITPSSDSTDTSPPPPVYTNQPGAEKIIIHSPENLAEPPQKPVAPPQDTEIHPILVHNAPLSPQHMPVDYPPDGYIPIIDDDQRIRLPPPHEMSPQPFTPTLTPPPTHHLPPDSAEESILMIPPPRVESVPDTDSEGYGRSRLRRRRSSDSQSTTFSQFDLVSPPNAPSARTNVGQRPNVLSAIVEERSPSMSPRYVPAPSPRAPSPVTMPTPQAPAPVLPPNENYYRRRDSSMSPDSTLRHVPSRSQMRSVPSPKGSLLSNAGFNITVEPPSRPESGRSFAAPEHGMLSASDAERGPDAAPQPPTAPSQPIPLPDGQLPPGFVPLGMPTPPAHAPQTTPAIYGLYTPAAAPGDAHAPPSTEPVVVPLPAAGAGARRYSRTALRDSSSESDSAERADGASLGSSASSASSSSSGSASMDSLTTPPARRRPLAPPAYATAPTPPGMTYPLPAPRPPASRTSSAGRVPGVPGSVESLQTTASAAARVPLPASSLGSPRSVYTRASRRTGVGQSQAGSPVMIPPRGMEP